MGFTLRLVDVSPEMVSWNANFAENSFSYTPIADSGWLSPSQKWNYPSDPRDVTTLHVWGLDANNNILFDYSNLGPIENSKSYTFNVTTAILSVEAETLSILSSVWLIVAAVIGVILLARRK